MKREVSFDKMGIVIQVLTAMNPHLEFTKDPENKHTILYNLRDQVILFSNVSEIPFRVPAEWEYDTKSHIISGGFEEAFNYKLK